MGEGGGGPVLLSPFLASIFPLFPQKRLILRLLPGEIGNNGYANFWKSGDKQGALSAMRKW